MTVSEGPLTNWDDAMKEAREIVWGPDAVFLVAELLWRLRASS